jgi:hypothetical protein
VPDRSYGALLSGEVIGLAMCAGTFLGAFGVLNPYLALLLVLGALVLHLTARRALRQ